MGIANAAVLPVPVCAWANRSRPACRTGMARVWTGVGAMKPRSSMAREMSGWIASSPKRAVGGARVNGSPVLMSMLTGETLSVDEFFQRPTVHALEDRFGIGFPSRPRLTRRRIPERDHRGDRRIRRNVQVPAHSLVLIRSNRVRAAADPLGPRRDHHVLRYASGVETEPLVQEHDRDRDRT